MREEELKIKEIQGEDKDNREQLESTFSDLKLLSREYISNKIRLIESQEKNSYVGELMEKIKADNLQIKSKLEEKEAVVKKKYKELKELLEVLEQDDSQYTEISFKLSVLEGKEEAGRVGRQLDRHQKLIQKLVKLIEQRSVSGKLFS